MAISNIMSQSMIMAKSSMKMAQVQSAARKQMDGKAGVLRAEIMQDQAHGADTKKKEEELAETKEKSAKAGEAAMNTMSDLNKDMEQASKADAEVQRAEKAAEKKKAEKAASKKKAEKEAKAEQQEKIQESIKVKGDIKTETKEGVTNNPDSTANVSVNVAVDTMVTSSAPSETVGGKVDIKL